MLLLLLASVAGAAQLDVCGGCPYTTIAAANADDVVAVQAGVYTETVVVDVDLTIIAVSGAGYTTWTAPVGPLVDVLPGVRATVDSFTMQATVAGPILDVDAGQLSVLAVDVLPTSAPTCGGVARVQNGGYLLLDGMDADTPAATGAQTRRVLRGGASLPGRGFTSAHETPCGAG